MKRIALITACCLLVAGLCLGQSDSMQQIVDSTTMDENSQKSPDSAQIVKGDCSENLARVSNDTWAAGFAIKQINKDEFDGKLFVGHRHKSWLSYEIGLKYEYNSVPMCQYLYHRFSDSTYYIGAHNYQTGSLAFLPGIILSERYRPYQASIGLQGVFQYGLTTQYETGTYFIMGELTRIIEDNDRTRDYMVGIQVTFTVERLVRVGKRHVSVGLSYILANGGYEWYVTKHDATWNMISEKQQFNNTRCYEGWHWEYALFTKPVLQFKFYF